ncbi:MAG: HEAT repeat domain-containing protein [Candidatus Omnitrophota bacterium]
MFRWIREKVEDQTFSTWRPEAEVPNREHEYIHGFSAPGYLDPDYEKINKSIDSEYLPRFIALGDLAIPIITELLAIPDDSSNHYLRFSLEYVEFALMKRQVEAGLAAVGISRVVNHPAKQGVEIDHTIKTLVELYKWHRAAWTKLLAYLGKKSQLDRGRQFTGIYVSPSVTFHHIMSSFSGNGAFGAKNFWVVAVPSKIDPQTLDFMPGKVRFSRSEVRNQNTDQRLQTTDQRPTTKDKASSLRSPATKVSAGRPVSSLLSSVLAVVMGMMAVSVRAAENTLAGRIPASGQNKVSSTTIQQISLTQAEVHLLEEVMNEVHPTSFLFGMMDWAKGYFNALGTIKTHRAQGTPVPDRVVTVRTDFPPFVERGVLKSLFKKSMIDAKSSAIEKAVAEKCLMIFGRNFNEPLGIALNDSDYYVRIIAAYILGKQNNDPRAITKLLEMLKQDSPYVDLKSVHAGAAIAIGEIGTRNEVQKLVDIGINEKNPKVGGLVLAAIRKIEKREGLSPVTVDLRENVSPSEVFLDDFDMGWINGLPDETTAHERKFQNALLGLQEKADNVKKEAAETLGRLKDRRGIPVLIWALKEGGGNEVRAAAAKSLGEFGDERAIHPLKKAVESGDESLRQAAKEALEKIQSSFRSEMRVDLILIAFVAFFAITVLLSGHELRHVKALKNRDEGRYGNYRAVLAQRLAQFKGIENPTEEQLLAGAVWAAPQAPAFFAALAGGFGAFYLFLSLGEVALSAALSCFVVYSMVKFGAISIVNQGKSGQGPEDSNLSDTESRSEVRLPLPTGQAGANVAVAGKDGRAEARGQRKWLTAIKAIQGLIVAVVTSRIIWSIHLIAARGQEEALGIDGVGLLGIIMACLFMAIPAGVVLLLPFFAWSGFLDYLFKKFPTRWIPEGFSRDDLRRHLPVLGHLWDSLRLLKWASLRDSAMLLAIENHDTDKLVSLGHPRAIRFMANDEWLEWDASAKDIWNAMALLEKFNAKERDKTKAREIFIKHLTYAAYKNEHIGDLHETAALLKMLKATALQISGAVSLVLSTCSNLLQNDGKNIFEKVLEVKGATPSFLREYFQMYKAGIYDPIVKLGLPPEQTVRDITKALNRTKISVIPAVTREEYEEETGYNQGGPSTVEVTIIPREEKIDLEPAIKEAQRIVAEATGRSEMRTYQTPVISQIPAGDASNLTAKIGTAIRVAANTHRSEVRGNLSAKPSTLFAKRLMLAAVMEMMAISGLVGCVSFRQATRFVPGPTNSAMVQAGSQVSSQRILTRAEEKRFREAIKGLKAERSWDQADAVKALVALKDPRAIPELIKLLDASTDEDYFYHNEVVSAIVKLKDSQTAPKLIEALKDKSGSVRSNAAKALTELKDPRAFLALIEALNDEDYKVRAAAAEALGALKDPKAVPALLVKLKDESWWVRSNAADALGAIKDSRATPGLGEAVKDEKMGVFISAAKALLEIGDFEAISVLLSALKDREYDNLYTGLFRQKALEKIMGFLEDPRAIPLAVEASKDKEDNVRNTAVEVLRQIRKAESERKKQSSPTSVDANEKAEARSETRSPSFRTESDGKVGTVRAEVRLMPEQLHTAATAIFAISSLLTVYFSGSLLWKAVKFRTGKFTASDREIALARSYLAQKGLPFYVGKNIDLLFNVLRYYIETDPRLARGFLPVAVLMYYGMINGPNSIGAVLLGGSVIVAFAYGKFLKWIAAHIASPDDLDVNQYDRPRGRSEETGRRPEGKGKEARSEMRNDEPDLALLGAVIKSMAYGSPEADGLPVQLEELSRSTLLYIFKDRDWVALSVKKGISMADSERDSEGLEPVGDDEANVEQSIRKIRQRFADRLREISRTPKAIREWRFFAEGPGKSGVNLPGLKREVQSLATFTPEIIRESEVFPNLSRETLMAFFLEDKARVRRWISANLLSLEVPGAIYEAEDRRKAVEDRIAAKLVDMSTTTSELMELTELKGEGLYENGELFEKLAKSLPYFTYAQAFLAQDFPGRALAIAKIDEFYQRQDINDQTKAEITARLSEFLKKEDPNLLNLMNSLLKRSQGAFYLRGNPGMPGQKKTVTIEIQTITRAFLELLKGVSDIKVLKALTSALIQLLRYSLLYGPADVKADIKEALIRFDDRAKSERIPLNIYDHMEAGIKAEMRSEVRSNEKPNRKALDWVVYPKRNALETIGIDKSSIGAKIGTAIRVAANTVSPLLSSKPAYASEIAPQVFAGTSHFQKVTVVPPALAAKWPVLSKIIGSSATASTERMVIDQRQGIPDAASLLPLVTFAAYNPKASVVLALIADASDVEAFIKELAALSPKGALPQNFKVKAFANENEFVRAFAGFYNDAAPLGQSVALVTDRENSIVTKKIGSRKKLLSVVGATSPLKQTASTLLAADKLLNEAIWSLGYHFVSVEKLGGLEALMAELTSYVATQAKVLASA